MNNTVPMMKDNKNISHTLELRLNARGDFVALQTCIKHSNACFCL